MAELPRPWRKRFIAPSACDSEQDVGQGSPHSPLDQQWNENFRQLISVTKGDAIPSGISPTSEKATFTVDPYRLGSSEWI